MILDEHTEFCDATAITGIGGATTLIGDVIDLGTVPRDVGQGRPLFLQFSVDTAFAGGPSNQFILASDSQATIATSGAESRHYTSDVFVTADLIRGFKLAIPLPAGDAAASREGYERYLGILGVGVGTHTAGAIDAFLTPDAALWRSYADAI